MRNIFSVTELNGKIKDLLEESFDQFWIEGEVSNLHRPSSGHLYFTLKDEDSQIKAVMFRYTMGKRPFGRAAAAFDLENGMSIVCRARLSVYQPRGEYQLLIDNVEPVGIGALQKAFEQLKARLQAEGLFDAAVKKSLPSIPRRIGIITSPTGAVIRDILTITLRRFPSIDILIAPVRVQSADAAGEIMQAIADMQGRDVDVIILARGGGSLEDLAPFNDEGVARAIFHSRVPIISAVGHETDVTIADFVADLRAPTPSAAAELVAPVLSELTATVSMLRSRMVSHQTRLLGRCREKLASCKGRLHDPRRQVADLRLAVDARVNRMEALFHIKRAACRQQLLRSMMNLRQVSPWTRIREGKLRLSTLREHIIIAHRRTGELAKKRLEADKMVLDTLNPAAILRRGYSITRAIPGGVIIKDADMVSEGSNVEITLASGGFQARVTEICRRNS